jgi:thiamine biosynthesis lipoprotein
MTIDKVKLACNAMATRFEIVLHGANTVALRAAGEEALREIERLHAQLSLYSESSEVSFINARAARQAVRVEPRLFQLLQRARRICEETQGAFDITVGPLLRCWGFMGANGKMPSAEEIEEARSRVGMDKVILDEKRSEIRFAREGVMIDLGSIGKGYALEVARDILLEAGIESAFLHGGTSTICAIGKPPEAEAWKVAIDLPKSALAEANQGIVKLRTEEAQTPLAVVRLDGQALSVSAVHGKSFTAEGKSYGHVIDPRMGWPAQGALLAAVALESATDTDAFSTALLLAGVGGHEPLGELREGMRTLVVGVGETGTKLQVASKGIDVLTDF